jgi:16S rRNA (guanine966-N2)-methyltransferase
MRIIAGSAKGRKLLSPDGVHARPTSDRAREALFSSLESEYGDLRGLRFLDLYSGSGAVAAEAISRGATSCIAVESDRQSLSIARENIEMARALSDVEEVVVIDSDVESFVARRSNPFDVIFLDPPYAVTDDEINEILKTMIGSGFVVRETLVVIERASRSKSFPWPTGMHAVKEKKYGNAAIYYGELNVENNEENSKG